MMATRRAARKTALPSADERLLVEAAQGDPAKFEALYELHFARVYGFVASRVHDRATAEDVTSEVFHKALANLPSYEWRGVPFVAWLLRIAVNAVADQHKRAARRHNRDRRRVRATMGRGRLLKGRRNRLKTATTKND